MAISGKLLDIAQMTTTHEFDKSHGQSLKYLGERQKTVIQRNHDSTCPPVRVTHLISCSYRDLDFLATHLDGITTVSYTEELMKKTTGKGDCCILTVVEWGHSRLVCEEFPEQFEDEDHMNYVGEFYFKVNETCLHGDHNIFMVAPNDRDAHNPILVHLEPSDMTWN